MKNLSNNQVEYVDGDPKKAIGITKTPMSYIPIKALYPVAEVMKGGADKYGRNNWRLSMGISMDVYISALLRHLAALQDGEDLDPESGVSHIAHMAANCIIMLDAARVGKLIDDRVI